MSRAAIERPKSKKKTAQAEAAQGPPTPPPAPKRPRRSARRNHPESPAAPRPARPTMSLGGPPVPVASEPPVPSPVASPPAPSSPPPRLSLEAIERQADILRRVIYPSLMATAFKFDRLVGPSAFRLYLDQMRADTGNSNDPMEEILLEQVALAHFRAGQLVSMAGGADSLEAIDMYNRGATRLMAEVRKTIGAWQDYRLKARVLAARSKDAPEAPPTGGEKQ
jgi:hypothetical protein